MKIDMKSLVDECRAIGQIYPTYRPKIQLEDEYGKYGPRIAPDNGAYPELHRIAEKVLEIIPTVPIGGQQNPAGIVLYWAMPPKYESDFFIAPSNPFFLVADALERLLNENTTDTRDTKTDTKIMPENRSRPMQKREAARLYRQTVKWLTGCMNDGTIKFEKLSRQSFIFDVSDFPAESQHKARNS